MSEKQAQILEVKAYTRWSPYLEQCCLLVSANESYERAAEDIEVLTGVKVSHSTQQRLVHRLSNVNYFCRMATITFPVLEQKKEDILERQLTVLYYNSGLRGCLKSQAFSKKAHSV